MNYTLPTDYTKLKPFEKRLVRLQYIQQQNNKCFYCNEDLDKQPPDKITSKSINWKRFPPNFLQHPIHLQHCHETGMTEGAVHNYCNAVMWQYENR